jgi:glycolate oxidase
MISEAILEELRQIAGAEFVRTDAETVRENSTDATKRFHPADVIVFVGDASQVSQIVRLCNRELIPVVSRGGGVGYAGGAIPIAAALSFRCADESHSRDQSDGSSGCSRTGRHYRRSPSRGGGTRDCFIHRIPASLKQSSIGGNVAHNAGGPRAFKYGVTRQYLLGLDVVLPTGELIATGGRVSLRTRWLTI